MSSEITMVPDPHLMESLRAVGYTLTTAVADIIDNSITAGSTSIEIRAGSHPEDYLAIVDDGIGMTGEQAQHAMRLAGTSSVSTRSTTDLGRFGLGLKTASLSQCRRLTLVSRRDGVLCGYEWDLDHLQRTQSWSLIELNEKECVDLPGFELLNEHGSGTLVLWRNLDILHSTHGNLDTGLNRALVELRDHLSLVFHRFLAGEHGEPLQIALNARPIEGADPLMPTHKATQVGPTELIAVDGGSVVLQAFTLPHLNKLTQRQRQLAQVSGSLRDSQGFYIYREKRLVIWGTWFRIMPKHELGKLARVRVDIPNTLDHLWSLDIKKAQAEPPTVIRERLKNVSEKMIAPSRRVAEYRGRVASTGAVVPAWNIVDQDGSFRYEINRKHPLVSAMAAAAGPGGVTSFQTLLGLLERSFPVDHAYNLLGQDFTYAPSSLANADLVIEATKIWKCVSLMGGTPDEFVASFAASDMFSSVADPESFLRKVARNEL
ncbi:ATP-binding protein [Arthrobacter ulcerisalmonis]|nr:ATP-binding protein [Arthrobacter ulcerisalmonis]